MRNNIGLYQQFKELVDKGRSPFQVADELGLTEDELVDFEVAYADEKRFEAEYSELDDSIGNVIPDDVLQDIEGNLDDETIPR